MKNTLKLLAVLCLLCIHPTLQAQWNKVSNFLPDDKDYLQNIAFISETEGYLVFNSFFAYTNDGGISFSKRTVSVPEFPFSMYLFNGAKVLSASSVLLYGMEGVTPVILKSNDKGLTWKLVYSFPITHDAYIDQGVRKLEMSSATNGLAVHKGIVAQTTDGGNTWTKLYATGAPVFYNLSVSNNSTAWATDNNRLWKINNGLPYNPVNISLEEVINVKVSSPGHLYVATSNKGMFYSADDGNSFRQIETAYDIIPEDWHFINDSTGYAVINEKIYKTSNYGATWELMDGNYRNGTSRIWMLNFIDQQKAFAGGAGPELYKTINSGGIPFPVAHFKIDLSRLATDSTVSLRNISTRSYEFTWKKNGVAVSNAYHYDYKTSRDKKDTLQLIVTNGKGSDTMTSIVETRTPLYDCNAEINWYNDTSTYKLQARYLKPEYREHTWLMGNGDTLYGATIQYQYKKKGYYTITHIVKDPVSGCFDSKSLNVNVPFITNCDAELVRNFQVDTFYTSKVQFWNQLKDVELSYINRYVWYFGDGDTLDAKSNNDYSHLYKKTGTFPVRIELSWKNNTCQRTWYDTVSVKRDTCTAKMRVNPLYGLAPSFEAKPLENEELKPHKWIIDDKDTLTTGTNTFFYHGFSYRTDYVPNNCNMYLYGWYNVYNMDSVTRKVKHIVEDKSTGCYAVDSAIFDLRYNQLNLMAYQDLNNPYSFTLYADVNSYSDECITIEGSQSAYTYTGWTYKTFARNGTYIMNARSNYGRTDIFRKKILVDGEYRYGNLINEIVGQLYIDANKNGIKDSNEKLFDGIAKISAKNSYSASNTYNEKGNFRLTSGNGEVTVNLQLQKPWYHIPNASWIKDYGTKYGRSDTILFALQPVDTLLDLGVEIIPANPARPGFDQDYTILVKNLGNQVSTVTKLEVNADKRFIVLSAELDSLAPNKYGKELPQLQAGESRSFQVKGRLLPPPQLNIRDTLIWTAHLLNEQKEIDTSDNHLELKQVVIGSYDPNDKADNLGGEMSEKHAQNADWIYYRIRFQNTGTDTAFNIIIRDTIDQKLDLASFEMLSASHPYKLTVTNNRNFNWLFKQIKLVDSFKNEKLSHGYLLYRIRPLKGLITGDSIKNTASIYFDFNLPVVTNTQITRVGGVMIDQPLLSSIEGSYCKTASTQKVKIKNLPSSGSGIVTVAKIDNTVVSVSADSSISFTPSSLSAGLHTIRVAYSAKGKERYTELPFNIIQPVSPTIDAIASSAIISDITQTIVVSANTSKGGNNPLFSHSFESRFTNPIRSNHFSDTLSIPASAFKIGDNWIHIKMRSSESCVSNASVQDSVKVTRSAVTGILDPEYPTHKITAQPNPFESIIWIKGLQSHKKYRAVIYNQQGQIVRQEMISNSMESRLFINVPQGNYTLQLFDAKKRVNLGSQLIIRK